MRRRIVPFILASALSIAAVAPAAATSHDVNTCEIDIPQNGGGAAALAALVAAAIEANVGAGVCNISVELLNNSLNNLLQNADIDVLNNALNNLFRNADIEVTVVDGDLVIAVLSIVD
jgi:hypothetical protein